MRYARSSDNEGFKTLLSAVVIVVGTWLAGEVGHTGLESNVFEVTGDIVGVWTWVAESPADEARSDNPVASFFEFRQADSGLMARVMLRDEDGPSIEQVTSLSFKNGRLCLATAGGTEFSGLLSPDGRAIDGTIAWNGIRSAASLERVATRKRPQVMVPLRDA
ncbi:MAG: hypothetical protein ACE5FP_04500 [Gemmatimonadota bacterium]